MSKKKTSFVKTNLKTLVSLIASKRGSDVRVGGRSKDSLNATDISVLLHLAANLTYNTPFSFVSQVTTAEALGSTPRVVAKSIRKLRASSLILRRSKRAAGGVSCEDKSCFVLNPDLFWKGDKEASYVAHSKIWLPLLEKEYAKNDHICKVQRLS
jgi:hypothetical protein